MADSEDNRKGYKLLAQYSSIVFLLPSALLGGYLLGRWLDSKLDTSPWLTMVLLLLGAVGGFLEVFRILMRKS